MLELRKDYITDDYAIISSERSKRPDDFKEKNAFEKPKVDFFGPGNEAMTPPEIGRWPPDAEGSDWVIRWFPNKFVAVKPEGNPEIKTDNEFFTFSSAYGYHEVIVETPDIDQQLADLSIDHIKQLLKIYSNRISELGKKPGIKYVCVFKNKGQGAATSIYHTHSQVIAYNKIPESIAKKENACQKFSYCPYEKIINIEKGSLRAVKENDTMVCFTPYASRFPMEVVIFPKQFLLNITEFNEEEYRDCAELLKYLLEKLKKINSSYNILLQYGLKKMRFHITIAPRLSLWGGFELLSGTIINTISPEDAAKFYRGEN